MSIGQNPSDLFTVAHKHQAKSDITWIAQHLRSAVWSRGKRERRKWRRARSLARVGYAYFRNITRRREIKLIYAKWIRKIYHPFFSWLAPRSFIWNSLIDLKNKKKKIKYSVYPLRVDIKRDGGIYNTGDWI